MHADASDTILGLHHVQITIPPGQEDAARRFYRGVLGLEEVAKPASLAGRGGFWLAVGDQAVHVGAEDGADRHRTKAHVAYEVADVEHWLAVLLAHGLPVTDGIAIPGHHRIESRDPFGNRFELIQRVG